MRRVFNHKLHKIGISVFEQMENVDAFLLEMKDILLKTTNSLGRYFKTYVIFFYIDLIFSWSANHCSSIKDSHIFYRVCPKFQRIMMDKQRQQAQDVTVTLTSRTIETSLSSNSAAVYVGALSPIKDPLYSRYLIKTLSSKLSQIICLLIPSLLIQYIIRLIHSTTSGRYDFQAESDLHNSSSKGNFHQSYSHQIQQELYDQINQRIYDRRDNESLITPSFRHVNQHQAIILLSLINHFFAVFALIYIFLLLVSKYFSLILSTQNLSKQ